MRRQWPCSICGFACASTWRSLSPSKPVICNSCRSKGGKGKVVIDPSPHEQLVINEGAKVDTSTNSSCDQIIPSSSIMHQNVAISVSQIGMIFGNLPFEPTLAIPVILQGKSQEPTVKSEVFTADDNRAAGFQHQFYCGKSSTTSVQGDGRIQIKQEYDCEQELSGGGNRSIWDTSKVQKKKRSKLPQYTLSPLARFINQLQHVSRYGHHPYLKTKPAAVNRDEYEPEPEPLKYDDELIYEKCKYVAENEIGLGAKLMAPPPVSATNPRPVVAIKEEPCSTDESGACFNCLIDVPIRSCAAE